MTQADLNTFKLLQRVLINQAMLANMLGEITAVINENAFAKVNKEGLKLIEETMKTINDLKAN